jgi:hypothetical protein
MPRKKKILPEEI